MRSALRPKQAKILPIALLLSGAMTIPASVHAESKPGATEPPAQFVDDFRSAFGTHHARAVHAKGVILEGTFTPTAAAAKLSATPIFASGTLPVEVRFSAFTGIPDIPDTVDGANPRGMAVKIHGQDGRVLDLVTHGFNGFPVATADEFGELLRAIGSSGADAPKPTSLDRFLAAHPIAKTFLTTQKPAPVSYATLPYFGVNSFKFIANDKREIFVRYRLVPQAGEKLLTPAELKARGPGYLGEEIAARVQQGAVRFDWFAQIAEPGDAIADPSIAWPEQRQLVKLGTFALTRMAGDQTASDQKLLFLPGQHAPGIENADPMLDVRNAAYPVSFGKRQ